MTAMMTNDTTLPPVRKIDRSAWGNDPMPVEVRAIDLIAGDLIPGLGRIDAILEEPWPSHHLVLCSGDDAERVAFYVTVTAHGAICPDCDMHPLDCEDEGCQRGEALTYCPDCYECH